MKISELPYNRDSYLQNYLVLSKILIHKTVQNIIVRQENMSLYQIVHIFLSDKRDVRRLIILYKKRLIVAFVVRLQEDNQENMERL